jgi:3' terminal RNA ribose 2'-O-methyltransferase Hen1
MLLTITTGRRPAADLGFLLHKHPDRFQTFPLAFGRAHVFYPECGDDRCTAALLLDVDPVGLVRGNSAGGDGLLDQYVNDRPYVASSFLSVAVAQVFGTALAGVCKTRPELPAEMLPLSATLAALPVRGGEALVRRLFEPLGYAVTAERHPLDPTFPDWGDSPYHTVTVSGTVTLAELLTHLYVLVPVFDDAKHYYVGQDELEKLLAKGGGWLAGHPEKALITRRYLKHRGGLVRQALDRLVADEPAPAAEATAGRAEGELERPLSLNAQRHGAVLAALHASGAKTVLDLGCGEGKLLRLLAADRRFTRLAGVDVSARALAIAARRLKVGQPTGPDAGRVELLHGSLVYRDARLAGFDAAAVIEVVEHLDPPRLAAFERAVWEFARPGCVVLTTPNREYNARWETLPAGAFRHADHRFEWTRAEFRGWAEGVAARFGYAVRFVPVGPVDEAVGPPTQMGVFDRTGSRPGCSAGAAATARERVAASRSGCLDYSVVRPQVFAENAQRLGGQS